MKICVFAASCDVGEQYSRAVRALGRRLGAQGHALVFGGYGGGLMADIADGFADAGADSGHKFDARFVAFAFQHADAGKDNGSQQG